MTGLAWRIYYWDGSTFDASQADPTGIPPERRLGVVAIVQPHHSTGRMLLCKWDWYYYRHDPPAEPCWWGSDETGFHDQITHFTHQIDAVLLGRHSSTFGEILSKANTDPDFPRRSAWGTRENRPDAAAVEGGGNG